MASSKKFFRFLATTILFMSFLSGLASCLGLKEIKERGYIKVSTNAEFDPFEYREGEEFVGIDIEIAKKIAEYLGVKIKLNDVSFDALTLELNNHSCDFAIAAMSYSEDRAKSVDFSEPYYTSRQVILVLNSSDIKFPEDIKNKKIGVSIGTTGDIYCSENYPGASVTRYNKITEAASELRSGEIDAIVVDEVTARRIVNILGNSAKILEESLFEDSYRVAVSKGNQELLNEINLILGSMTEKNEVTQIVDKYLSISDSVEQSLSSQIYNNLINKQRYKIILQGLATTLKITFVALMIGILLGAGVALVSVSRTSNIFLKIIKLVAKFYVLVIRGTPVVIQLFVIHYLILSSPGISKVAVAMITFGINSGAYVSEIVRSGILSIDGGQYEAGRCLGLSERMTMRKIILPQAFKNILPTLMNEFIQLIKETSVAGFIGVVDLSRAGDIIKSSTYQPLVPLLSVAIIYFVIVSILTLLLTIMERRIQNN